MKQQHLNSFLTNMFNDRVEFANINGISKMADAKYMLIADVLSENVELLGEVIDEHFKENINSIKFLNLGKKRVKCLQKR